MKFVTILTSLVLVLGLAAAASAGYTNNFAGTEGGTWGTATWTGSQAPPSGGSLTVTDSNKSHEEAKLQLYLGKGQAGADIAAGGGFAIEFDIDSIGHSKQDAFSWGIYHDGAGVLQTRFSDVIDGWGGTGPRTAGLYKFEFAVTSGTWGSGNVDTSVTAYKHDGSDWALTTPGPTTMTITDTQWDGLMSFGATAYCDGTATLTFGNDLEGGLGLNIYALPEPATVAILGLGSLVLLRKRR